MGAMVFGGVASVRLPLNEETLWSGAPSTWNTPGAQAALPGVREAILAGDYAEADRRARALQGAFTQSYQPLGDLYFHFAHGDAPMAYNHAITRIGKNTDFNCNLEWDHAVNHLRGRGRRS